MISTATTYRNRIGKNQLTNDLNMALTILTPRVETGKYYNDHHGVVVCEELQREVWTTKGTLHRVGFSCQAVVKDEDGNHLFEIPAERWNLMVKLRLYDVVIDID